MNQNLLLKIGMLVSLIVLCLSACARLPTVPVGERPMVQSAPDLLKQLESRSAEIQSFKGKGNASIVSPQMNYSGNTVITGSKPSLLRVDLINVLFGQPLASFLMNEQEIKLLDYRQGKLYRGPASSANLSRFVPLPVSRPDFMAMLTGRVAFEQYEKPVLVETKDPSVYYLELTSRGGNDRLKLTIDSQSLNITAAQWQNPQGQETMRAEFGEFVSQGTITGPLEIKLTSADQANQVRIRYRDLTFNVPSAPEAMALPVSGAVQELAFPQ
jgi:outer membrane lipoprotein-sorting protein